MRTTASAAVALTFVFGLSATTATAAEKNPIFGGAKVTTMSKVDNAKVAGKGYYADIYGYYGNLYASYAYYYGTQAYDYSASNSSNEYNNYYNAYYYSGLASENYYNAYIYSYYGY